MQHPGGAKREMEGHRFQMVAGHHWPPRWRRPYLVDVIGILMYVSEAVCFSEVIFPAFDL